MARKAQLVCEQLENISHKVLDEYQAIIREYIRGRNGVYALYRRDKLYYVGLASSLSGRLKAHLRDRHGNAWDRFSVYLTVGDSHLKEMESLLLRIAKPPGNRVGGKFYRCDNLKARFKADIKKHHWEIIEEVFGGKRSKNKAVKRAHPAGEAPPLALYLQGPRRIRGTHKGTIFRANVRKNGSIRFDGVTYNSPSHAASKAVGHSINGWWFWHVERGPGNWVRLQELRH